MTQFDPEQITFFAKTDARGQQVPFGIKAKDRTKHVYVIGKTGMGKSTLLENMAVQDIKNGNGLAFIDPHGATAETLLEYIPDERKDDVLYFAPFDTDNPISFNVMEDVGPDKRHLVVSGLMSVFKKIWVDAWSARMEYILSNTLLALLEYPDSTLLGVNRMLSDKHYRRKVIDNISDPAVKSFWVDEFLNYNERYMQEAGDAIKNKIGQFTANPLIRNIIGQPHTSFDLREIMDGRKILIANLSKGLVGESNANLLGSMLTTRLYLSAMSRADLTSEQLKQMPNFYFYVDEFQSFANATFADILSEARKYKLNLTIAHQYIEQMEEEVRNAVFGNVGTIISFRVGPFDAEILETIFTPKFLAADIVNLGFAQVYLTLMIDGIGSQPFSAQTLPPIAPPQTSMKHVVIAHSRQQFAKERGPVENVINTWHEQSFDEKKNEYEARKAAQANAPSNGSNNGNRNASPAGDRSGKPGGASSGAPSRSHDSPRGNGNSNSNSNDNGRRSDPDRSNNQRRPERDDNRGNGRERDGKSNRPNDKPDEREGTPKNNSDRQSAKPQGAKGTKNEKSVDELRSILKNLVNNSGSDTKPATSSPKQPRTNETSPEVKQDLQAALGSIGTKTGQSASPTAEQSRPPREESGRPVQRKHDTPPRKPSDVPRESRPPSVTDDQPKPAAEQSRQTSTSSPVRTDAAPATHDKPNDYQLVKNIDDPLAPKKLERMMRVTGSDQSPFK